MKASSKRKRETRKCETRKRETSVMIKHDVKFVLLPRAEALAEQVSIYHSGTIAIERPMKLPVRRDDWLVWRDQLACTIEELKSVITRNKSRQPPVFPAVSDILFTIISFLLPGPCTSFQVFSQELDRAFMLWRVSKKIQKQIPVYALFKSALVAFQPLRIPVQYQAVLAARGCPGAIGFKAWARLQSLFRRESARWPYAKVFRGKALKLWNLTVEDTWWCEILFTSDQMGFHPGYSCCKYDAAWAALCCNCPTSMTDDAELIDLYINGGFMPPHKQRQIRDEADRAHNVEQMRTLSQVKAQNRAIAVAHVKHATEWPLRYFSRTRVFRSHSDQQHVARWLTTDVKHAMASEIMARIIFEHLSEYQQQDRALEKKHNDLYNDLAPTTLVAPLTHIPEPFIMQPWTAQILGFSQRENESTTSEHTGFKGIRSIRRWKQSDEYTECIRVFKKRYKAFSDNISAMTATVSTNHN